MIKRHLALAPFLLSLAIAGCSERSAPTGPDSGPVAGNGEAGDTGGSINKPVKQQEGGAGGGAGRPTAPFVPGEIVVDLSDTIDLPTFNGRWGTSTILELEDGQYALVTTPADKAVWDASREMVESGDCQVAEPNYELESPEANQGVVAFVETGHVFSDVVDQNAFTRIGVPVAQSLSTGQGAVIAIIDTGIDASHPDLAGTVGPGWDFVDDDPDAGDFADGLDQDGDGTADEGAGHGTHVAGIIHGIAPDALLLPVRVLDTEGIGTSVTVARGVRWAVDQGATIINLSLGMEASAGVVKDAVKYAEDAGVFVVASAGNLGIQDSSHFPAKLSNVAAVAATDSTDLKASFSSYGSFVNVSAPGEGILSTYLGGTHAIWSGTSFSTPMVAAGVALWMQVSQGSTSPSAATDAVEESAAALNHTGLVYDGKMGQGRLDVGALVLRSAIGG